MKSSLKAIFNRLSRAALNEFELERGMKIGNDEAVAQRCLIQNYRLLAALCPKALPAFNEAGFRKYSQFEEDGILLYIFSLVSPTNRTCVEICAGNGRECMATNLIVNHGWWGFLFDGDPKNVADGKRFFGKNRDTFFDPPHFNQAWITAENVNEVIAQSGIQGPVDLLSLDIDGMDYWVWKAINVIDPQVVICETHNLIPPEQALTVPYDSKFVCQSEEYRGASLAAMTKLGRDKGYRLIGCHRYGFNAFFMKQGVGEAFFPEVSPADCMRDPATLRLLEEKWPVIRSLPWETV